MDREHTTPNDVKVIGRYTVDLPFAAGGMASVHLGRVKGPLGFSRTVAVKRLLPALAADPALTARFVDEARLASRVRHANVVPTLDVVAENDELLIVMDYVAGLSLSTVLVQPGAGFGSPEAAHVPLPIVSALMSDILEGLHAAHGATSETGQQLSLVHRDVSPQNVIVGSDGIARVIDFGIATASEQLHRTDENHVVGKIGYMAPEQLRGDAVTFAADIYGASVMLWELLAHRRFKTTDDETFVERVLLGDHDGPRTYAPDVPVALEAIVMQGLSASATRRFPSAHEMGVALQAVCPRASALEVAAWLDTVAAAPLRRRAEDVARFEATPEGRLSELRPPMLGLVAYDPTVTMTVAEKPAPSDRAGAPRRRSRVVAAVLAGVTVAGALAIFALVRTPAQIAPREGASEIRAVASASAPALPALPPPLPVSEDATTSADPPPTTARASAGHRGTKPATTAAATTCKVPFYFDKDGMKHYRPECMK